MATTFIKIAAVTVGAGGASNITFSAIPATYTDLSLLLSARVNTVDTEEWVKLEFNGSGGTAYSDRVLWGNGSGAFSASESGVANVNYAAMANAASSTSTTFSNCEIYIPNYAGSNNKSFSSNISEEQNATKAFNAMTAGLWSNTSAITSIKLTPANAGTLVQYSTATLYGIKNS
jgi:hypothetical protein